MGPIGYPDTAPYNASDGAVWQLTRSVAIEVAEWHEMPEARK